MDGLTSSQGQVRVRLPKVNRASPKYGDPSWSLRYIRGHCYKFVCLNNPDIKLHFASISNIKQ